MFGKSNNITRFVIDEFDQEAMAFKSFFDLVGAPICSGFVDYNSLEPVDSEIKPIYITSTDRDIIAVRFRIDKRTVPGKLLKKEVNEALKKLIAQKTEINADTGEVEEYVPSKGTVKELKSAIKNKLLKEVLPVPSYFDCLFVFPENKELPAYGYFSSTNDKEFEELKRSVEEFMQIDIVPLGFNQQVELEEESDFHAFLNYIWERSEQENELPFYIYEKVALENLYNSKAKLVDFTDRELVDNLLNNTYGFKEALLKNWMYDTTLYLKDWYKLYNFVDEELPWNREDGNTEEVIISKMLTLDNTFNHMDNTIKSFLEN
jgi:hypothetical protein